MKLRKIAAMKMPDIVPGGADMPEPKFSRADPAELLVDEGYQRNLSERSVTLIRGMVARWSWRSFQPPLCVRTKDGSLHVVDGQHTAIAAATHPKIKTIPIMLVDAPEHADRARAFLGRNRDRITVTPNQLYHAAVAAGEDHAVTISQVCRRAGVTILKTSPGFGRYKPGDTMAVSSVSALVYRHGALRARQILDVITKAKVAPIPAGLIKAVEVILTAEEHKGAVSAFDLGTAVRRGAAEAEREAKMLAAREDIVPWRALVVVLLKRCKNGHRRAA